MCFYFLNISSDWLWYYNGEEDGDFTSFKNVGDDAASDYDSLTKWLNLPLQSGDVIAHRFKAEWKECYSGSELAVSGMLRVLLQFHSRLSDIRNDLTSSFGSCFLFCVIAGAISNTNDPTRFRQVYSNSFSADWYKQSFDDSSWNAQDLAFGADSWTDDTSAGKVGTGDVALSCPISIGARVKGLNQLTDSFSYWIISSVLFCIFLLAGEH